jgi:hypothetical protein
MKPSSPQSGKDHSSSNSNHSGQDKLLSSKKVRTQPAAPVWKQVAPGSKPVVDSKNSAPEKLNQMDPKKEPEKTNSGSSNTSSDSPPPPMRLKYEMCKNWRTKGSCPYGDKCLFAHGE